MVSEGGVSQTELNDPTNLRNATDTRSIFCSWRPDKPGKLKDVFPKNAPDCSTLASSPCSTNPPNAKPQIR